jgi:hypothetical protein
MNRERLLVSGAAALAVFIGILILWVLSEVLGSQVVLFATLLAATVFGFVYLLDSLTEEK